MQLHTNINVFAVQYQCCYRAKVLLLCFKSNNNPKKDLIISSEIIEKKPQKEKWCNCIGSAITPLSRNICLLINILSSCFRYHLLVGICNKSLIFFHQSAHHHLITLLEYGFNIFCPLPFWLNRLMNSEF